MLPPDPNEPRLVTWARNPRVRRTLILAALWTFMAVVLASFRAVLLPFGVAVLIAFIMEPLVDRVSKLSIAGKGIPRVTVILSVYVICAAIAYLFFSFTLPQIGRELGKLGSEGTQIIRELEHKTMVVLDKVETFAHDNNIPIDRAQIQGFMRKNLEGLAEVIRTNASKVFTVGRDIVAILVRLIFGLFLVLMLTAFISLDRDRIERFFESLVPWEHQPVYRGFVRDITTALSGVVRGQLMICVTNGILTGIGLAILDVKFPLILATVATFLSLIPIFGSILSSVPIVAIALTDSLAKAVFVLLWIIGIHLVEANLLNPKIMGNAAKIHPVIVVFVLIVGERTSGLVGALFAVPIASVVITAFKYLHKRALAAVPRPAAEEELGADAAPARDPARTDSIPPEPAAARDARPGPSAVEP